MNLNTVAPSEEDALWAGIVAMQNRPFFTVRGQGFTYTIKRRWDGSLRNELCLPRKEKPIKRDKVMRLYRKAKEIQEREGCVSGPELLGCPDASYLYPIFLRLGVCTRTPQEQCCKLNALGLDASRSLEDVEWYQLPLDELMFAGDLMLRQDVSTEDLFALRIITAATLREWRERSSESD